jgi:hypothetical protein
MPKPDNGSECIAINPSGKATSLFAGDNRWTFRMGIHHIGGILKHAKPLLLSKPTTNSTVVWSLVMKLL